MRSKFWLLILIIVRSLCPLQAQEAFHQVFESYSESRAVSAAHPSGGYAVATSTFGLTGNFLKKLHLMYVNDRDEIEWSVIQPFTGNILPQDIKITATGDIIIASYLVDAYYSIAISKFSSDGEHSWTKVISGGFSDYIYNIHISKANEIVVFGNTDMILNANDQVFIMKMDMNGKILMSNIYKQTNVWGTSAITSDGNIVVRNTSFIFKVKPDGSLAWSKALTQPSGFTWKIIEDKDGNYVFLNEKNNGWFLSKVRSTNGELMWVGDMVGLDQPNGGLHYYRDMIAEKNGGYIVVGTVASGDISPLIYAISTRFDAKGKYIETIAYEDSLNIALGTAHSSFTRIVKNKQGGILFIGNTGVSGREVYVVKPEADWTTPCASSVEFATEPASFDLYNVVINPNNRTFNVQDYTNNVSDFPVSINTICRICNIPSVTITGDSVFCGTDEVELSATGSSGKIKWSTGDSTASIKITKAGEYSVSVSNVCGVAVDTFTVEAGTVIKPKVAVAPTDAEPLQPVYFSDQSTNVLERQWFTGDGYTTDAADFTHRYEKNGNYLARLLLTSPDGCPWDTTIAIRVMLNTLMIPNAFSPNNDNINDIFDIQGFGIHEYHLQVFDRWGMLIFEGQNKGWNGRYKNESLPEGVYFYRLSLSNDEGKLLNKVGEIYLVD